jgi:gamma-carbonic anhydrase
MLREYDGHKPVIHSGAFVSKNCLVIGRVSLGENVSVWPGCVLRADVKEIIINANTNIQDGVLMHSNVFKNTG